MTSVLLLLQQITGGWRKVCRTRIHQHFVLASLDEKAGLWADDLMRWEDTRTKLLF